MGGEQERPEMPQRSSANKSQSSTGCHPQMALYNLEPHDMGKVVAQLCLRGG